MEMGQFSVAHHPLGEHASIRFCFVNQTVVTNNGSQIYEIYKITIILTLSTILLATHLLLLQFSICCSQQAVPFADSPRYAVHTKCVGIYVKF